jgi:2-isopropylmalate synthase
VKERIYLYDSTLRDGAATRGINFTADDKRLITQLLIEFGIDFIEAGWPGANLIDEQFFSTLLPLMQKSVVAFGMTRRPQIKAEDDSVLNAVLSPPVKFVEFVGKSSRYHVEKVLHTTDAENLKMIFDTITYAKTKKDHIFFIGEHFFDGYKLDSAYALETLKIAYDAGAEWISVADTNGGTLPHEIEKIVEGIFKNIPNIQLGIHAHNDTENAVANSLAAVRGGARLIQGTINGIGERCGNANLISIIPTLMLKMGFETGVSLEALTRIKSVSAEVDTIIGRTSPIQAPYIGKGAFTHKGGLHIAAVDVDSKLYEHIPPESVGNNRSFVISHQAGRATMKAYLKSLHLGKYAENEDFIAKILVELKSREFDGYSYDGADASFELLIRSLLGQLPHYFKPLRFSLLEDHEVVQEFYALNPSQVTLWLESQGQQFHIIRKGQGPIHALELCLKDLLLPLYPGLSTWKLEDYRVKVLQPNEGSLSICRVHLKASDSQEREWTTVGVSSNIIDASLKALAESLIYKLYHDNVCLN